MKARFWYSVRELLRGLLPSRSRYQYDPLPPTRSIRLLELSRTLGDNICCSLKSFELSRAPPFHALSYTWGYPLTTVLANAGSKSSGALDFLRKGAESTSGLMMHDGRSRLPDQKISDDVRRFPILCDGRTMLVTANLYDALDMLRKADVVKRGFPNWKYVWIDAICVDQDNILERNVQVAMMAQIFRAAHSVIVWLGPEDDFTKDALTVIDCISSLPKDSWPSISYTDFFNKRWEEAAGIGSLTHLNWLGFLAFINRPWFRRSWVVQELALARSAILVCGSKEMRWERLDTTLTFLSSTRWYHHLSTEKIRHIAHVQKDPGIYEDFLRSKTDFGIGAIYLSRTRKLMAKPHQLSELPSLDTLMHTHRETEATDPRDKVYAFLGLADKSEIPLSGYPESIEPDYKLPVHEVYTRIATSFLLFHADLRVLSHVQDPSRTRLANLPSWVPDFSTPIQPYPLTFRGSCHWSASGDLIWQPAIEAMREGLLHVQGARMGAIEETAVMPDQAPDPAASWASIVKLATHLDDQYPFRSPSATPQTRFEVLWRTLITNTYAREYPAPPTCGTLFMDYILNLQIRHTLAPWSKQVDFQPQQTPTSELNVPAWHKLLALEPKGSSYGPQLYRERISIVMESIFQGTYSPVQLAQLQHEFDIANGNMRRVFRTRNGLLGTGARSLSKGDEVWVLAGANVPLVLRRLKHGVYRLVGEAYVHGIMHAREHTISRDTLEDITLE
jgi:Heterokaryon incompatibility protein (HET)